MVKTDGQDDYAAAAKMHASHMELYVSNIKLSMDKAFDAMWRASKAVLDEFRRSGEVPEGVPERIKDAALNQEMLGNMGRFAFLYKNMAKVLSGKALTDDEDRKGVIYFALVVSSLKDVPDIGGGFPELDGGAIDEALQNKYAWRALSDRGDGD